MRLFTFLLVVSSTSSALAASPYDANNSIEYNIQNNRSFHTYTPPAGASPKKSLLETVIKAFSGGALDTTIENNGTITNFESKASSQAEAAPIAVDDNSVRFDPVPLLDAVSNDVKKSNDDVGSLSANAEGLDQNIKERRDFATNGTREVDGDMVNTSEDDAAGQTYADNETAKDATNANNLASSTEIVPEKVLSVDESLEKDYYIHSTKEAIENNKKYFPEYISPQQMAITTKGSGVQATENLDDICEVNIGESTAIVDLLGQSTNIAPDKIKSFTAAHEVAHCVQKRYIKNIIINDLPPSKIGLARALIPNQQIIDEIEKVGPVKYFSQVSPNGRLLMMGDDFGLQQEAISDVMGSMISAREKGFTASDIRAFAEFRHLRNDFDPGHDTSPWLYALADRFEADPSVVNNLPSNRFNDYAMKFVATHGDSPVNLPITTVIKSAVEDTSQKFLCLFNNCP